MTDQALKQIQAIPARPQLSVFSGRLLEWLNADLNESNEPFTESRARALLIAANLLDEPTRTSFNQLVESEPAARLALYDLLRETGLAEKEDINGLAIAAAQGGVPEKLPVTSWLALAIAAHAFRSDFRLDQLDPASPPDPYSPAGQVLKRAAYFIRQQVQRGATERDKLSRKVAYQPAAGSAPDLNTLQANESLQPILPYYRPPVPVRYPEYSRDTVKVDPQSEDAPAPVSRAEPLSISDADLAPPTQPPAVQPAIRIDASQLEPPQPAAPQRPPMPASPPAGVTMPGPAVSANTRAVTSSRGKKPASLTTKLRVVIQEYPEGPGLYGLQVRVSSQGAKRFVAGTTNQDGHFLCELPVRLDSGLTYDVDVTWPRDFGGEVERKSITLNADRTLFILPFYRTLKS